MPLPSRAAARANRGRAEPCLGSVNLERPVPFGHAEAEPIEDLVGLGVRGGADLEGDSDARDGPVVGSHLDVGARHAQREAASFADLVGDLLGADERRHQELVSSSRSAAAASSALISLRARRSRIDRRSAAGSAPSVCLGEPVCKAGTEVVIGLRGALRQAEGADQRVDPAADGGVADAQLALHLLQVAPRAEEALEQAHLVAVEATEAADPELAFERGPAAAAVQSRDGQLPGADRAGGDDVVDHD